ncbi:MAG: zinc ribbon domain-containing protein [Thermoplasmatota archaeon]
MNQNICQSCGMPMQYQADFGTNANGGLTEEYCQYCYKNGRFVDEGITMEQKIMNNIQIAVAMGMDKKKATEIAYHTIPQLKRWEKKV